MENTMKKEIATILFYRHTDTGTQVLLQKKDRGWPKGGGNDYWTVFGGSIELGESPEECIVREVREELGLNISESDLFFFEDIRLSGQSGDTLMPLYLCEFTYALRDIKLDEGCGWAFHYLDEIPRLADMLTPH